MVGPGEPDAEAAASAEGDEEGDDDDEEEEEENATIQAFPLRGAVGGSRMMCALPDHRVQVRCLMI